MTLTNIPLRQLQIASNIIDRLKVISKQLRKSHEYEYLTSREAIIETIEANDYDFTENGKNRLNLAGAVRTKPLAPYNERIIK